MFDLISISEAIKQSYASKGLLVDVRSEEAFKKGHLPMAVNIPFTDIMKEKFDIEADFNVEKEMSALKAGHAFEAGEALFERITPERAAELQQKYSGAK